MSKEYILNTERARGFWDLVFPDWEGPVWQVFLLFLDYKIQGGTGALYAYRGRFRFEVVYRSLALDKLVPKGIEKYLDYSGEEREQYYPALMNLDSSLPWARDLEELEFRICKELERDTEINFERFFKPF